MANRVGMPNIQKRGLGHVSAQKQQPQQSSDQSWWETIVPLAVGAITTAALSSLLTPAGAAAVAGPTLMGSTIAGSTAAGLGGTIAGQGAAVGMQDAPPGQVGAPVQAPGMGGPRPMQGQQQLSELVQPPQGAMGPPQGAMAQPVRDGGVSQAGAMMRGFASAQ